MLISAFFSSAAFFFFAHYGSSNRGHRGPHGGQRVIAFDRRHVGLPVMSPHGVQDPLAAITATLLRLIDIGATADHTPVAGSMRSTVAK